MGTAMILVTFHTGKQLIIELDGRQHFEQVMNWKCPFEQQLRDKYKELWRSTLLATFQEGNKMPVFLCPMHSGRRVQ